MTESAEVSADTEVCIGSGNCVSSAPEIFDQSDDGTVVVRRQRVEGDAVASVREAADNCPAFAILLSPTGSGTPSDR